MTFFKIKYHSNIKIQIKFSAMHTSAIMPFMVIVYQIIIYMRQNNIKQVEWIYFLVMKFSESQMHMVWFFLSFTRVCVRETISYSKLYILLILVFLPFWFFWFFSPFWFFGFFFQGLVFFRGFCCFQGFCFRGFGFFRAIYIIIWTLPPKAEIFDTHTRHPMKTGRRWQWKEFFSHKQKRHEEVIQHHRYTTNFCVILDWTYKLHLDIHTNQTQWTKAYTD